jgi:hypothetical protein
LNPNSTLTPNSPLQQLPRAPHEIFSLGWYNTWFYCENHEPDLPAFEGRLPKCQGTWLEEPIPSELALVVALTKCFERARLNRSLRGYSLASPPNHSLEEAGPPEVGVQRNSRSDWRNHQEDQARSSRKAFGRDVPKCQQLVD